MRGLRDGRVSGAAATLLCALSGAFAAPPAVQASPGIALGAGLWRQDPAGRVQDRGNPVDLNRDLGTEVRSEGFAWIEIAPPVPLLPRLRLAYSSAATDGVNTLQHSITFGGATYPSSATVSSQGSFDQYDATLFYPLVDAWVRLDLGLNLRYIDGSVQVSDAAGTENARVSGAVPMLYLHTGIPLPVRGVSIAADASYVTYGGNRLLDYTFKGAYETPLGLGAELGWRNQEMRLNDFQNVNVDASWRGPYAGVFYSF